MKKNLPLPSWSTHFKSEKVQINANGLRGFVWVFGAGKMPSSPKKSPTYESIIKLHSQSWQQSDLLESKKELQYFVGNQGPVWILRPQLKKSAGHYGLLEESLFTWTRDLAGSLLGHLKVNQIKNVDIEFIETSEDQELGFLVGLNMAAYQFKSCIEGKHLLDLPQVGLVKGRKSLSEKILKKAAVMGDAINLARHFVNLPPNDLNPIGFVEVAEKQLKWPKEMKIKVWEGERLKKENMGLLQAVGAGGSSLPRMLHLQYRPRIKSKKKPIAFVGKGITFDSGGLDIKPSAGMRLMKKDMGGAAALLGLAHWVAHSEYGGPCDFYFALAENMVDAHSMRPGDVYKTRSGLKVEIDNTDAEGRLVLADVLDVAVTAAGEDEPQMVVDVATLTGAIKVALGADIAGLFSNDDALADRLLAAGISYGDPCWRMPLVERYFNGLNSAFADFKNSTEGFGGAITAALFLQKFIRGKKWAHLDIYSWNDKALGPYGFVGGSGQGVSCLIGFLEN